MKNEKKKDFNQYFEIGFEELAKWGINPENIIWDSCCFDKNGFKITIGDYVVDDKSDEDANQEYHVKIAKDIWSDIIYDKKKEEEQDNEEYKKFLQDYNDQKNFNVTFNYPKCIENEDEDEVSEEASNDKLPLENIYNMNFRCDEINPVEYSEEFLTYYKEYYDQIPHQIDCSKSMNISTEEYHGDVIDEAKDDIQESEDFEQEMPETDKLYVKEMNICRNIFIEKLNEYGASWRIMHSESITDQILIRYFRLSRMIDDMLQNKHKIFKEFCAIVNYAIIGLIQLDYGVSHNPMDKNEAIDLFDKIAENAYNLMKEKNADFGDGWKIMRLCSFVDFIGLKTKRIMELEMISDDSVKIPLNYYDIINYAIFTLIRLS